MADSAKSDLQKRFISEAGVASQVAALIEPVIEDLGLRLVRVTISSQNGTTLQIMADRPGGVISVDDCAIVSRQVSPLLDAHDPIQGRYVLEVSSPGVARPLVRPADLDDWAGFEAKIELNEMIDGRRRFRGVLDGYDDENAEARLRVELKDYDEPQIIGLPISLISDAKLVMTDELLKMAQAADHDENAKSGSNQTGDNLE